MYRMTVFVLSVVLATSAFAAKKEKEYVQGKLVDVVHDALAGGVATMMAGQTEERFTYTIDTKEGEYEARESSRGAIWFKPLEIGRGETIMFRVNSRGSVMYVPIEKGEKILQVTKFTPASSK